MSDETLSHRPTEPGDRSARRRARPLFLAVTGILVVSVFTLLMVLGVWQVHRLHWKEGLLAKIAARMHGPPLPLARIEALRASGQDIEYRHVRVSGTFDNARERHFLATLDGHSGFDVFTPLTTDSGEILFVNRGFVPYDRKDPATRPDSLPRGPVTLTGLARAAPAEKPSYMVPKNSVAENIFYWKDLAAMAASTGLAAARVVPFFVDADRVESSRTLPIGGATVVDLPNDHLQYAITWFGLAAVLLFGTGTYIFRQVSNDRDEDAASAGARRP